MRAEITKYRQNGHPFEERVASEDRKKDVLQYAPLIHFIANRLAIKLPPSVSREELVSAGVVGLLDAIEKFDESLGIQFKTYAEHRIRGAMLDELRKMDWFPRSVRKDIQRLQEAILALETKLGREPEDGEIARELGLNLEEYFKVVHRSAGAGLLNLEDVILSGSSSLGSQSLEAASPMDELRATEIKSVVASALKGLSETEQKVVSLYYYEELTLREIAEVFHVTESRISQIHSKAIVKLRAKLQAYYEY